MLTVGDKFPALTVPVQQGSALPAGETLASELGPELYAKFTARAKPFGLDPEFISHFKPWFAATMLRRPTPHSF